QGYRDNPAMPLPPLPQRAQDQRQNRHACAHPPKGNRRTFQQMPQKQSDHLWQVFVGENSIPRRSLSSIFSLLSHYYNLEHVDDLVNVVWTSSIFSLLSHYYNCATLCSHRRAKIRHAISNGFVPIGAGAGLTKQCHPERSEGSGL